MTLTQSAVLVWYSGCGGGVLVGFPLLVLLNSVSMVCPLACNIILKHIETSNSNWPPLENRVQHRGHHRNWPSQNRVCPGSVALGFDIGQPQSYESAI